MNPTRRRRRHLSSEEREDAFRAAAAREAGAAPKGARVPTRLPTRGGKPRGEEERMPRPRRRHSSGTQQKPSVPSVADQVSDGEVKVTRRRPGDGGGAAPRLRVAPLATSASRARIAVARARRPGSKAPSPSPFPQAAPGWWRGLDPVFVRTTTACRRITPASGFSPPCPERIGVS